MEVKVSWCRPRGGDENPEAHFNRAGNACGPAYDPNEKRKSRIMWTNQVARPIADRLPDHFWLIRPDAKLLSVGKRELDRLQAGDVPKPTMRAETDAPPIIPLVTDRFGNAHITHRDPPPNEPDPKPADHPTSRHSDGQRAEEGQDQNDHPGEAGQESTVCRQ